MVGFHNLLVHIYSETDEEALYIIITSCQNDLRKYCVAIVRLL
jgi:uncharacterized protein YutE (UPF0331/DUF86 family)